MGLPSRNKSNTDDTARPLNDEEEKLWAASLGGAAIAAPILQSSLALMRPYKSKIIPVSAIDRNWRVGLGDAFFKYSQHEREAIVVHECLHVVCNHFQRAENSGQDDWHVSNVAEDLEINQMIVTISRLRMPEGTLIPKKLTKQLPWMTGIDVPPQQTMEKYYNILGGGSNNKNEAGQSEQDQQDQGQSDDDSEQDNTNGMPINDQSSSGNYQQKSSDSDSQSDEEQDAGNSNGGSDSTVEDKQDASNGGSGSGEDDLDGDDDSSNSSGSGDDSESDNGMDGSTSSESGSKQNPCGGVPPEDVSDEADSAGIPKAPIDQQIKAHISTVDAAKERASALGTPGAGTLEDQFAFDVSKFGGDPPIDWRRNFRPIFQKAVSSQAYRKTATSFRKINRRGSAFMKDVVFPGMVGYQIKVVMAIDTSASVVSYGDQLSLICKNAEEIMKAVMRNNKNGFSCFCVDTQIKPEKIMTSIDDLDLTGGGGTDMAPAFKYVNELKGKNRPDIFILASDGEFMWDKCLEYWPDDMKVIIMITSKDQFVNGEPKTIPAWVMDRADVIDVSGRIRN